jgi:hypothetical protein
MYKSGSIVTGKCVAENKKKAKRLPIESQIEIDRLAFVSIDLKQFPVSSAVTFDVKFNRQKKKTKGDSIAQQSNAEKMSTLDCQKLSVFG